MRIIEIVRYVARILQKVAKYGDSVLVISDTATDPEVWQACATAANEMGLEYTIAIIAPPAYPSAEPPRAVAEAMKTVQVVILATSLSIMHSKARHQAAMLGVKTIGMSEMTVDALTQGAVTADYDEMFRVGEKLSRIMTEGEVVRVTSELGSDLTMNKKGRLTLNLVAGVVGKETDWITGLTAGECPFAPIEGTAEGTIIFDTIMSGIGLLEKPIKLTVKKGKVVNIEGGAEARRLQGILETQGDYNSYMIAEFAIGTNPKARITSITETKMGAGKVHIALGDNITLGGSLESKLHLDGVMEGPTVYVDGRIIVEKGKIKI